MAAKVTLLICPLNSKDVDHRVYVFVCITKVAHKVVLSIWMGHSFATTPYGTPPIQVVISDGIVGSTAPMSDQNLGPPLSLNSEDY